MNDDDQLDPVEDVTEEEEEEFDADGLLIPKKIKEIDEEDEDEEEM